MIKPGRTSLVFILASSLLLVQCRGPRKAASSSDSRITEKYAVILDVNKKEISNVRLYKFIDDWTGVPYKYGGKTRGGVDCSGLVTVLYKSVYGVSLSGGSGDLYEKCNSVRKSNLKEGDLVFFKINSKQVSHVGVYLQNGKFVHASVKKGVMINDLSEAYYQKYYFRGGRLK